MPGSQTLQSKPVLEVFVWSDQSKTVLISSHLLSLTAPSFGKGAFFVLFFLNK